MAKGDVFGIDAGSSGSTDGLLRSLYSTPDWTPFSNELIYFKVISLEPACKTSLAFDPERTNLMLEVSPVLTAAVTVLHSIFQSRLGVLVGCNRSLQCDQPGACLWYICG